MTPAQFGGRAPVALLFDCDGLLADTEARCSVAEAELFRRRGREFGRAEKELLIGRSLEGAGSALTREFGEPPGPAVAEELLGLVREAWPVAG